LDKIVEKKQNLDPKVVEAKLKSDKDKQISDLMKQ